jgi:hypothetical protein
MSNHAFVKPMFLHIPNANFYASPDKGEEISDWGKGSLTLADNAGKNRIIPKVPELGLEGFATATQDVSVN